MSLPELQLLSTSVRVAPLTSAPVARCAVLPKTCCTMLLAVDNTPSWPAPEPPAPRQRFMGRRSA